MLQCDGESRRVVMDILVVYLGRGVGIFLHAMFLCQILEDKSIEITSFRSMCVYTSRREEDFAFMSIFLDFNQFAIPYRPNQVNMTAVFGLCTVRQYVECGVLCSVSCRVM